jgi:hypothetical protein
MSGEVSRLGSGGFSSLEMQSGDSDSLMSVTNRGEFHGAIPRSASPTSPRVRISPPQEDHESRRAPDAKQFEDGRVPSFNLPT